VGTEAADLAVEACTGWRFVVKELTQAGFRPHLAEPTETATSRGRKRRTKTDPGDARWQRELLSAGSLPESWIPPTHVLEVRALVRLYADLLGEHIAWRQRLQATLFHPASLSPATSALNCSTTSNCLTRAERRPPPACPNSITSRTSSTTTSASDSEGPVRETKLDGER
jgi:hypothetical protein